MGWLMIISYWRGNGVEVVEDLRSDKRESELGNLWRWLRFESGKKKASDLEEAMSVDRMKKWEA